MDENKLLKVLKKHLGTMTLGFVLFWYCYWFCFGFGSWIYILYNEKSQKEIHKELDEVFSNPTQADSKESET